MKNSWGFQGGWDGHEPHLTSARFAASLRGMGYEATIHDSLDCLGDLQALQALDLVVFCWTMGEIKREYTENLSKAVGGGVGLDGRALAGDGHAPVGLGVAGDAQVGVGGGHGRLSQASPAPSASSRWMSRPVST